MKDYGITLDNSATDKARIQTLYDNSDTESVFHIPIGGSWDGTLTSNPAKHMTWLFDGKISSQFNSPIGDGDVALSFRDGIFITQRYVNNNSRVSDPIQAYLFSSNPNFANNYAPNGAQNLAAITAHVTVGPVARGNTSAGTFETTSYGNQLSGDYDVNLVSSVHKYGQTSSWGYLGEMMDFTAKAPGAFAQWNEFDLWANGRDRPEFDPNYGKVRAGNRTVFYTNIQRMKWPAWSAGLHTTYVDQYTAGNTPRNNTIIYATVSGVDYLWYAITNGVTGSTAPAFPAPGKIVGNLSGDTLTITSVVSGTPAVGQTVTGDQPIHPAKILSMTTNTDNTITCVLEHYPANEGQSAITGHAFYIAPDVTDNTVTWRFGEENANNVGTVHFLTGLSGDSVDFWAALDSGITINNAVIDSSAATLGANAAALRVASGQTIDFSGNGTLAGANKHTLKYSGTSLNYTVNSTTVKQLFDGGVESHTLTDGITAAGTTLGTATALGGAEYHVVTTGSGGVTLNAVLSSAKGNSQTVINETGAAINVYPINTGWWIGSGGNGVPYSLPAGAAKTFINTGRFNNHIAVK